ncbi:flagellar brake protein [Lysobacter sp. Root494]|uniref:flagellar brake protein n=1 Tax=Lysobacter sp. Root494 TaxID=1736549 RepID=UPI0006FAAB94|nr:flagellar brake protein [Lysobacter sp. Root494]KQY52228.1 hypothetical protein ASD14_06185 [Lysobacter sp. Root494]
MTSRPTEALRQPADERCYEKYMVHGAGEIRGHLHRLLDARSVLVAHAVGAAATQVTALLHVGEKSLLIDVPRAKDALREWLDSAQLRFEGSIERISVVFTCGPAWLDRHDDRPALGVPFPGRLLYQQRRDYLRIAPPMGSLRCRLPVRHPAEEPAWIDATIRDIGGGGLAMLSPANAVPLVVGETLEGCVIDLPFLEPVTVNLLVRHVVARDGHGPPVLQAGCEFVGLPLATQDKLLRYVMQLDRERVSRRRAQE